MKIAFPASLSSIAILQLQSYPSARGFILVNRQNIQLLLDEITHENLKSYLTGSGWHVSEGENQEMFVFTKGSGEDEIRLWSWNSSSHPKFRSRLQNLIFTLAVQHSREPIEIANEIYDSVIDQPESDSAKTPEGPFRLDFRNTTDSILKLEYPSKWNIPLELGAAESVNLCFDTTESRPSLEYAVGTVRIATVGDDSLRVFDHSLGRPPSFQIPNSPEWSKYFSGQEQALAEANCRSAWQRAEFELSGLVVQAGYEKTVFKSVSLLLAALASELDGSRQSVDPFLWTLCRDILHEFAIEFEVFPKCTAEFSQAVLRDEKFAPMNTLDWLNIHALPIG